MEVSYDDICRKPRLIKIFIVHYKPLINRKMYIINEFKKYNFTNYEFCEDYDRDTTAKETMDLYFKLNNLNPAQICITISHIEIYKKIINENIDLCLILEDDAILCENFFSILDDYIHILPSDFEIGFINNGCNMHASNITANKIWYDAIYSRTCCAYIITNICCKKLLQTIVPFNYAIDHELNEQIKKHNLKTYWAEPTIVSDGSSIYGSSYIMY